MEQTLSQSPLPRGLSSQLVQYAWVPTLRGVVSILFGGVALFRPGIALAVLVVLFGTYALADGVLALITSVRMAGRHSPWLALLFEGVVSIAAGIIAFRTPGLTAVALLYVVGAWAIVTGVLEIAAAVELRAAIPGEWAVALGGILSILTGWLLLWQPGAGLLVVAWTLGVYAILFGGLMVSLGARMRRLSED